MMKNIHLLLGDLHKENVQNESMNFSELVS